MRKYRPNIALPDHKDQGVVELLRANVQDFPSIEEAGETLARCFDSFGSAKILLIGDASHGTSEFYVARAELTKHMIEKHGFNIVATESDWPDAEAVDRYVRHRPRPDVSSTEEADGKTQPSSRSDLDDPEQLAFLRFPTWMWRNLEVHDFVEWLRKFNKGLKMHEAVGFYGLDLYSLGTSMQAVVRYLDNVDKDMANIARERYASLMSWAEHPHQYGLETLVSGFQGYEKDVVDVLRRLLRKRLDYSAAHWDGVEFHSGEQNARLVRDAEYYYKTLYYARDESWNLRDSHMFETLVRILKHRGPGSKAIVWAHNSHVGDARATSMGWGREEHNIGQLCKEAFGDEEALNIGCSGNTGTVAAAKHWDSDMCVMRVNPGLSNSYEQIMHATGLKNFAIDLREGHCNKELREALAKKRLERFIGVVYRPDTERQSHYSSAVLPQQFDGLVWFDEMTAVKAMETHQPENPPEYDETWPFGL